MGMLLGTKRALLGGAKLLPFNFDASLVTFTPGMAKRAGPGPFAAAPIMQGKWDGSSVPDILSFLRGAQISGHYYAKFDGYQGGGFCFWTPEQATNARTGDAYIWYASSNYYLKYDYTNDRYELGIGGQTMTVAAVLVAGTMEILAWGFDTNNTLTNTSYAYFSRNNVQTYGMTTQPTAAAPAAIIYVGSDGSANPSNAIPGALVFVREIPWTGSYGTDMGVGDIVAAHFAAGVGEDIALSIGSWGTTYSMPTDSTPGALVTGTGEAWSHPHADAEANLTDAFCQTAYAAGAWGDEGTPITPLSMELYDGTDHINFGSGANIDDLPDAGAGNGQMTLDFWFRLWRKTTGIRAFISKGYGWKISVIPNGRLRFYLNYDTTDSAITTAALNDNRWHNIRYTYDEAGDRKPRVWVDGVLVATGVATAGNYVSDAASDLIFAGGSQFSATFGWIALSNSIRGTANFVPDSRINPPANDANYQLLINMDDGAGAVATDTSGNGYNGTITSGRWRTVADMATDCPGQRIGNWGYVHGTDAANEGIKQVIASLTPGDDYVLRVPLQWERDRRARQFIRVYDEINAATIVDFYGPRLYGQHSGANNSATLVCATGNFPQCLMGAALYNITDGSSTTIAAISGDKTTVTGILAGGTDNDWDTNDVFMLIPPKENSWVWCEETCFELPALCTSISVKKLEATGDSVGYVHQFELLDNLWDDPGMETGTAPTNVGTPTTSAQSAEQAHSGANSWKVVADAVDEGIKRAITTTNGKFYHATAWVYALTAGTVDMEGPTLQDGTTTKATTTINDGWERLAFIFRATGASTDLQFTSNAAQTFYVDDVAVVELDDVSLTVTPASLANSLETSGLRVDGHDLCSQPTVNLKAAKGKIKWKWMPRHDAAELTTFIGTLPLLVYAWGDANNWIILDANAANSIRLWVNAGGAAASNNWNCTGLIVAGTTYEMEVRYSAGTFQLYVGGVLRASCSPGSFTTIPTIAYWGSSAGAAQQVDATYAAP